MAEEGYASCAPGTFLPRGKEDQGGRGLIRDGRNAQGFFTWSLWPLRDPGPNLERILLLDQRAREISGAEAPGGDFLPVVRLLAGESFVDTEVLLENPDGARRRVLASGSLVRAKSGPSLFSP